MIKFRLIFPVLFLSIASTVWAQGEEPKKIFEIYGLVITAGKQIC